MSHFSKPFQISNQIGACYSYTSVDVHTSPHSPNVLKKRVVTENVERWLVIHKYSSLSDEAKSTEFLNMLIRDDGVSLHWFLIDALL